MTTELSSNESSFINIKERITQNLSGQVIFDIMQHLIMECFRPIICFSNYNDIVFAELLGQVVDDHRRKVSSINKSVFITKMFNYIVTENAEVKMETLQSLYLEKTIQVYIIDKFIKLSGNYLQLEADYIEHRRNLVKATKISYDMRKIEQLLGINRNNLAPCIRWIKGYFNEFLEFKSMILEKYYRYAYNEAVMSSKNTNIHISKHDLYKNLQLAMIVALYKFDPKKGPLTSCMRWWFKNAKTNPPYSHEVGYSFDIDAGSRRKLVQKRNSGLDFTNNFAVELTANTIDMTTDLSENSEETAIRNAVELHNLKFLKQVQAKEAKIVLEIPYILSSEEKQLLLEKAVANY